MGEEPFTSSRGPELYLALARAIRAIRAELGIERRELAERSGVSYPYLSEIETGKKRPSSRALVALAEALGLAPSELLQRAEALTEGLRAETSVGESRAPVGRPLSAPAAMPAPGASREAGARRWFALGTTAEPESPDVVETAVGPRSDRQSALSELFAVAGRLPEEDLQHLLELARRLSRD